MKPVRSITQAKCLVWGDFLKIDGLPVRNFDGEATGESRDDSHLNIDFIVVGFGLHINFDTRP